MTKHVDPTATALAALMAEVRALRGEVASLRTSKQEEPVLLLSDFSTNLAARLEKCFARRTSGGGHPPVWTCEKTGQRRASLHDVLKALKVRLTNPKPDWAQFWANAQADHAGHFEGRHDLKRKRGVNDPATLVIDLEIAEALILGVYPIKGKRQIEAFKATYA